MNRNPRYSLRSFAKDLKMAPALVSDVLNGKRGLSRVSATQIAARIGLSVQETKTFCDLVESKHGRSRLVKAQAQARLNEKSSQGVVLKFLTLENDQFDVLADWYHLAILELMKTPGYQDKESFIAKRLGLSSLQVRGALERLEKLDLVVRKDGRRIPSSQNVQTPDGISSRALKAHHEQFLKLANEALFTQPVEERDFRGLTIKCKKSDVPHVREKIRRFLHELDRDLSDTSADGEEVYQLSTQLFSLTKPITNPGETK